MALHKNKIRYIPDQKNVVAYQAFVNTLGKDACAQSLMKILGEHYITGKNYFSVLRKIDQFKKILIELDKLDHIGMKEKISQFYLEETKNKIKSLTPPLIILTHSLNVITSFRRDFLHK